MKIMNRSLVTGMAVIAAAAAGVLATAKQSLAESHIYVTPIAAQHGIEASIGGAAKCPCLRWSVKLTALSGRIETKDILISSEALFAFQQTNSMDYQSLAKQMIHAGQIEIMAKLGDEGTGHIGAAFNGVQWGSDPDRGLSNILRVGGALIGGVSLSDSIMLDGTLGFDWDKFTTMFGKVGDRMLVKPGARVKLQHGPWSGQADVYVGLDASGNDVGKNLVIGGKAKGRVAAYAFSEFELGISAELMGEYDGFREMLGLNSKNGTLMVGMDLSWVEDSHSN